ncbi:uncharacterized protein Z520_06262 [Fonsecaea multimorphosa CBS 102226]|uniref:PH domain-containing protein n=1 Tax=Fonsecaea multimorphosa CBS 102226 TaxID=1442371 RepID=A0A0D2JX90_9EURO|nr:uncharacterized protein Z520_06262 [Fonsecaea multimorphosa CBS 102226]KIX98182.1 hypothetical protein Z520_06262 [Fonsecaea multimorphosa CBS 102226]OAL24257.1 hypothetical protein AYO22_05917 [Fonsecaea multimorphosa]
MATAEVVPGEDSLNYGLRTSMDDSADPFVDDGQSRQSFHGHRYSSLVDPESIAMGASMSPSQVKRSLIAHLAETERRLHDAQKLGESLLLQQSELNEKLREMEEQQGEAEITPELRQRLADLEKEHNDVGKEIARALLGPKSRAVSGEEKPGMEQAIYSSQATASPSKVMAPSRRQRNQPSNRGDDLQFAADISTSLLAQVRQLQSAVAERDELLKEVKSERDRLEKEAALFSQRLRALDESEQKYKDENWNLETQTHELLAAAREAADREKRLTASLAAATAEKGRMQSEMDEVRAAHEKLAADHATAKKAHDSELHTLKRTIDLGDSERSSLQHKIDELMAQNQELARAVAARLRSAQPDAVPTNEEHEEDLRDLESLEHSPPPSPTKATPRPGALESETLRSSLHHAHRMIQNLKNNIHREKTEKIELRRMLQDARDELEQRRGDGSLGSASKRQKPKPDTFKKPVRPDMLGGSRRARTDVELEDDDWEDHAVDTPSRGVSHKYLVVPAAGEGITDASDAYQTANETEGNFETADERHATESEDFQTGAESLAGDSTDDLTETEDTASHSRRAGSSRRPRPSLTFKPAGDRQSFVSTASDSAEEEEEALKTPVLTQPHKFRLRNGRQSFARQSRVPTDSTPTNLYSDTLSQDSPATVSSERSLPAAEQSLFAELGGLDETASFGTPGRASLASVSSTPGVPSYTPSRQLTQQETPKSALKYAMVNAATMTDPWEPERDLAAQSSHAEEPLKEAPFPSKDRAQSPLPSEFPLPPTVPTSPVKHIDHSTQYTPQRGLQESPIRNTAFITPPKTVWDEAQSPEVIQSEVDPATQPRTPTQFEYSGLLMHDTTPVSPETPLQHVPPQAEPFAFSAIQSQTTEPVQTPAKPAFNGVTASTQADNLPDRPQTAERVVGTGLLASAAAALGFAKSKDMQAPTIAEDETSEPERTITEPLTAEGVPLKDVSGNKGQPHGTFGLEMKKGPQEERAPLTSNHDRGSQTLLTSEAIDEALRPKTAVPITLPSSGEAAQNITSPLSPLTPTEGALTSDANAPLTIKPAPELTATAPISAPSPIKRPSSASSQRVSSLTSHPPLPADHKEAIAKASSRVASPTKELGGSSQTSTVMGPPAFPASAMRRPRTPGESMRSPTRDSNQPRTSNVSRTQRGTVNSQMSRRSSVSSFASEIDERFNMHQTGQVSAHNFSTDPRIIQAITQTMIGEFLWKYTRKAGRSEMSETRHRRYFWVHPYTKTLYWSDQDPQTAGRTELKAKSVQIESVQVVPDDNPMPPGLHRKSLEVITPGRRVRFTASTGQRHETWFNALNYLLLRGEENQYGAGGNDITRDDLEEFNVNGAGYGAALIPSNSRMSLSSYNSRTTRGSHRNSAATRQQLPPSSFPTSSTTRVPQDSTASRAAPNSTVRRSRAEQSQEPDKDRTVRASSVSRFSRMLGSVTGRTPKASEATVNTPTRPSGTRIPSGTRSEGGSIYDASVVSDGRKDSAEELRREMLRQEEAAWNGGLENVRACCDGKHDVSTLSHSHRHASSVSHGHRNLGLSMSLRGSVRRRDQSSTPGPSGPSSAPSGLNATTPTRQAAAATAS